MSFDPTRTVQAIVLAPFIQSYRQDQWGIAMQLLQSKSLATILCLSLGMSAKLTFPKEMSLATILHIKPVITPV